MSFSALLPSHTACAALGEAETPRKKRKQRVCPSLCGDVAPESRISPLAKSGHVSQLRILAGVEVLTLDHGRWVAASGRDAFIREGAALGSWCCRCDSTGLQTKAQIED